MQDIFIAQGLRTPFSRIDGALAAYNAIELSVPVAGDTHIAGLGSVHRRLRSPSGCVLLLRSEYPLPGSRTP